ncbi:MAG: acyl carrier protein [Acidobacteriota bacterium]|nr:MAG: acyl carrier protein [Acidobacteriota bacterium]
MMSMEKIRQEVGRIFAEQMDTELPSPDADLIESGILDSLSFVEMLYQLEQSFAIEVPLETLDLDTVRSVSRISEYVASRIA